MSKPGDEWVSPCKRMILRCGRWQDVLADVESCDAVITDPPYSAKVHSGFRSANDYKQHSDKVTASRRVVFGNDGQGLRRMGFGGIPYEPLTKDCADALSVVDAKWHLMFCDHRSFVVWERAAVEACRYVFAPVLWLRGRQPRFQGDGPSCDVEYICVSRRSETTKCGSLPGLYEFPKMAGNEPDKIIKGQKPVALMREIVPDYSRPDDLIVDPFAGSGTTLLAAAIEGRRAIGAEMDPKTYALAVKRLSAGYTPRMQMAPKGKPKQDALL